MPQELAEQLLGAGQLQEGLAQHPGLLQKGVLAQLLGLRAEGLLALHPGLLAKGLAQHPGQLQEGLLALHLGLLAKGLAQHPGQLQEGVLAQLLGLCAEGLLALRLGLLAKGLAQHPGQLQDGRLAHHPLHAVLGWVNAIIMFIDMFVIIIGRDAPQTLFFVMRSSGNDSIKHNNEANRKNRFGKKYGKDSCSKT